MTTPAYLKSGDKVAIVSTARKVSEAEMTPAVELLKQWGIETAFGKNLFNQLNQFAGTDEDRTQDFQDALNDPSVKAILFARGGYGTVRIIDKIDWSAFKINPKWLIGFSDVTVTHSHVQKNFGIETLHAPMAFNLPKSTNEVKQKLRQALFGEKLQYEISENIFSDINRPGECTGELVGGNLSILYSLLGSSSSIDTNGKILFLEDLDEYLYHIDRMMMALKRAGKLYKLAGLIVGGMNDMKDNKVRFNKTAEEIISEAVSEYNYPLLFGFPAGHVRNNMPLIFGRKVNLKVVEDSSLSFS
ncbi:MAG: LD-carboxypeptidase [Bacteroidetes bacterium]|nr:LD-carboxypeptidase [Bacteroidota bacterium]